MAEVMLSFIASPYLILVAWFGALAIGVVYFVASTGSDRVVQRLVASAYAPAFALHFAVWVSASALAGGPIRDIALKNGFLASFAVPLVLAAYSIARYPGPQRLHWALAPLTALCVLPLFVWGFILTFGK